MIRHLMPVLAQLLAKPQKATSEPIRLRQVPEDPPAPKVAPAPLQAEESASPRKCWLCGHRGWTWCGPTRCHGPRLVDETADFNERVRTNYHARRAAA